jgi:hypothetical protein
MIFTDKNINIKKFLQNANLCILLICSILFSCGDETVTNPDNQITFDSARFNWTTYSVDRIDFNSLYSPDSSNIYMVNAQLQMMTHISNGVRIDYPFVNFDPVYIMGLSNHDIYIFGYDLTAIGTPVKLKRFNGVNFSDVPIDFKNNNNSLIWGGMAKNINEIWLTTSKYIAKYDDSIFTEYAINDSMSNIYSIFYNNNNSNLQYINYRFISFYEYQIELFQLNKNMGWQLIYSQPLDTLNNFVSLQEFNGNKYGIDGVEKYCMYTFGNSSYNVFQCLNPYYFTSGKTIDGISFNEFSAIIGGFDGNEPQNICNWNGQKWSKESFYPANSNFESRILKYVNSNLIVIKAENEAEARTYIYRGIRK